MNLVILGKVLPKLYRIAHPKTPYRVIYTDPKGRRIQRHFANQKEAADYHREILRMAKVGGTAGLIIDRVMRSEYFAARDLLGDVPLLTAVRFYLKHQPNEQTSTPLMDLQKRFLDDKRRMGRAVRTIEALDSALGLFLAKSPATIAADFTQDVVREYLDGLHAPPLTIRTHRARLSAFGEWLARRGFIPDNPVRHIDVAKYDPRPPRILTPEEAETLMRRAQEYRDGMFAPMFAVALFAGLRHGELMRLTWADVHLDGDSPIIRVGQGKIRGRRAVRIVPIEPNLLSWLKWARAKNLALVCPSSDARKVREAVPWQTDITRHSWISYRLALVNDEARVAREAGNSPDVIYRHYFQLTHPELAAGYFKTRPTLSQ